MTEAFTEGRTQKERAMTQKDKEEAVAMFYYFIADEETSRDEIIDRFSQNSQHYEKAVAAMDSKCATKTAETTAALFPSNWKNVYILDVAAGTGLCAQELFSLGFRKMDALDPSKEMLAEARKKGLYGRYFLDILGENTLDIDNDTYDAVTISGMSTMVLKKLPVTALEQLVRIVKPGGYIINTSFYNIFSEDGDAKALILRESMKTLESRGKWKQVDLIRFPDVIRGSEGGVSVHRVLT